MAQWLVGLGGGRPVAVALEIPHGPVVDVLLERGCHVFALNPRQMDRFRDRYSAAGAKDDRRDGRVLASALRTDPAAFRRLEPDDPAVRQLREWTRIDAEVGTELRRLTSRLREQLLRFYPQALGLCPAGDEPWFWALLQRAPTPAAARRLRPGPVAALLRQHHIRRLTAETVLAALQVTPVHVAPGTVEAATAHIGLLLPRLALLAAQQRTCADQLERGLAALTAQEEQQGHRDVAILRSLPGVGNKVAATMLAEAASLLTTRDYHQLRAYSGVAPVTRQSGKRRVVGMRYACNGRLRNALHHWGSIAVQHDPVARRHYEALRARGHSYGRALRSVADRLLALLMVLLRAQTLYDPARRAAAAGA
jgi:transposase